MANEAQSAVALRTLIRTFPSSSPGVADDMQNMNTSELPDGAQCYCTGTRQLFRFRKFSTAAAVANIVIVPSSGGGRWVLESFAPTGALPVFLAASAANTADTDGTVNWTASQTSNYALQGGLAAWTLTAGCVLHYIGPAATMLVTLTATVTIGAGSRVDIGVSHNDDLVLAVDGFAEGTQFHAGAAVEDTESVVLSTQRRVVISPLETLRPKFRFDGGADLDILRLTMSAVPLAA